MKDVIFEVVDSFGKKIRLTKRQWAHAMKRHPYMEKYLEEIKETLKAPDKMLKSPNNKGYYYKSYKHLEKPNRFILVVVKYLNNHGFIVTSYLMKNIR